MNIVRRALCRVVQLGFRAVLPILPYSEPEILKSLDEVPGLLRDKGVASVLLVSDPGIKKAGLYQGLVSQLEGEVSRARSMPIPARTRQSRTSMRRMSCIAHMVARR